MNKAYYRASYIQKGYGLGSIFRSVAKLFRPIARNIRKTIDRPEVRNVLKTMGKETLNTGGELLIDSIKGKDVKPTLDKRIKIAKQRIANSIEEGINMRKRARRSHQYTQLDDEDYLSGLADNYVQRKRPKVVKKLRSSKRKRTKYSQRTVLD